MKHAARSGRWATPSRGLAAVTLAVAALLITSYHGAVSAGAGDCRVRNLGSGQTYSALQTALDAARSRARLTVMGTCAGSTLITRSVVITGIETARSGVPILSGERRGRVLDIRKGARVRLLDLHIIHGRAFKGAGIRNRGNLILRDVSVRQNDTGHGSYVSPEGAGIWNAGRLHLNGATRIARNWTRGDCAGVMNSGALVMSGASIVAGNNPYFDLTGGVCNGDGATLTMNGRTSIRNNGEWQVTNSGRLTMNGTSWIRPSSSDDDEFGAGVDNWGVLTMNGASAIRNGEQMAHGVDNYGRLVMNDASSIRDNPGGGVHNQRHRRWVGFVAMRDESSIRDNSAVCRGGGVENEGTFRMTGASSISGNTIVDYDYADCEKQGGGLYQSRGPLVGVSCGPGGNVHGNAPDDCYFAR